ncbi:TPA: hypothetical protein ACK0CK_002644 [Staphylococcus aureus]
MAITNHGIELLGQKFEGLFTSELGHQFASEEEYLADQIIDYALKDEGFPIDANMYNVKASIQISSKIQGEDWAEDYVESQDLETDEELQQINENDLIGYIFDNMDKVDVVVNIDDSLEEWLEEHGTVEYLEEKMEDAFDELEFIELIEQNAKNDSAIIEKTEEALREEGFPDNVTASDVDIYASNVKLTVPFETIAEHHIDDIESSGGVSNYINNKFYDDILNEGLYDFDLEIASDIEDYQ